MAEYDGPLLAFSGFIFDPATGELTQKGLRIRVGKQVSDLLATLLAHPGELVTRNQIRAVLWPQGDQIDFEKVINNGISRLRFLLQDDPKNPRYIERIPKRGYRLMVPVERIERSSADAENSKPTPTDTEVSSANEGEDLRASAGNGSADAGVIFLPSSPPNRAWLYIMFAFLVLLTLSGGAVMILRSHRSPAEEQTAPAIISLEVAHIESDTPDLKSLAGSFELDLVDALSQLPELRVKKQHDSSISPAGDTLSNHNFQTILYGRLTHLPDKCHLEFELVRASDGTHLASFQYNGSESEFALIREKMQQDVFLRLKVVRQHGFQAPVGTSNQEAYQDYLQARLHFWQQTNDSVQEAVREFRVATEKDRNFAAAYAGLGRALFVMGEHGIMPRHEAFAQASDAITTALRLDPVSAEVHGVSGLIIPTATGTWRPGSGSFGTQYN
jgi:DNA-binding winged helix-turn-helix (wHTH) protein